MIKFFMSKSKMVKPRAVVVDMKTGWVKDQKGIIGRMSELQSQGWHFTSTHPSSEDDGFITVHPAISDGGPASYYDFKEGWVTWNDLADHKAKTQWKEYAFHLGNIGKAIMRWGDKEGTSTLYDTKKIIYSALRVLVMMKGKEAAAKYLEKLSDDPQFKVKE